ncbi:universal stress protein [Natronolimnohabitans sp. A-GB9]|uniref:universal stress protein n=1 Tax=Natronolimnohabitans sp. A-GB9 TaxID=3069757 RepID=UPI0027B87929|nr:universal stress protein [Natronolimnohabitans sp. A-GB9]MDQ2052813.1 universal stress protein [Natronolimnohabitans sp. A-GB9]
MVVVAAVDQSKDVQHVLEEGRELADAFDESLHVVHAVDSIEFAEAQREHVSESADGEGVLDRQQFAEDRLRGLLGEEDGDVEIVGLDGDPAESIVEYATEHDARYVVLGGRKRSPVGKALFGSVAQSVVLSLDRPTVIVQPDD